MDTITTLTLKPIRVYMSAINPRGYSVELEACDIDPNYYTKNDNISAEEYIVDWFKSLDNTGTTINDFIIAHNISPDSCVYCELYGENNEGDSIIVDSFNISISDIRQKL